MKSFIFHSITLLIAFFFILSITSCGDEGSEKKDESAINLTDNIPAERTATAPPSTLLGKWKHIESRIPNMEPIHMETTYIDFSPEGKVTNSNPNDADMDDLTREYTYSNGTIVYDRINYTVEILTPDSMVLVHEVDGDQIKMIYVKEE